MLFKTIDFPEAILDARAAGDLVIFAGAGVSIPSPSSLPSFRGLATKIREGSGMTYEDNEPDDRYLGRLKTNGIDVHAASANILVNANTKPHELHRLLYELFPSREHVRIVTTNFDTHFSTAGKDIFGSDIPIFYAPALPLGNDFSGLVYLHGCAGWDPNRCVLTDEDFGRAYLTEGWTARFLAAMFTRYVVVFIGYSHNDTVMNYLSCGLPPKSQSTRFAFSLDDANLRRNWDHLAIKPLLYQETSEENAHQALTDSIKKFVEVLNMGLLEEAQRIQSILKSPPPLEGEDTDYLKFVISKLETARIFFRHARTPEVDQVAWLTWLEKHGLLKPLFNSDAKLDSAKIELSFWVANQFVVSHSQELLSAIYRSGGQLNRILCFHIYGRLAHRESKEQIGLLFSQWTALLLSQGFDVLGREDWEFLFTKCQIPEDTAVGLLLFDHLTRPHVILDEELTFSDDFENVTKKIAFSLNLFDDKDMWTDSGWNTVLKPNLTVLATQLEPIVSTNIAKAHSLMNLANITDYDPLYFQRQSIEHGGPLRHLFDVVVDAARDIAIHLTENEPVKASGLIERWFASDAAVLRRLATFAYSIRRDVTADDKLRWLLNNDLLFKFYEEVRLILNDSYASSSPSLKSEILARATTGPVQDVFDEDSKVTRIHRLLVRLSRLAPDCELTSDALRDFLEKYPHLAPSRETVQEEPKHQSRFIDQRGAFNVDMIIATPPSDFLEELLAFSAPVQQQYCNAATNATERRPEWGIEWINNLISRELDEPNLWTCICFGWKASNLSTQQWHLVLSFLTNIQSPPKAFLVALIELLVEGFKRESFNIPDSDIELTHDIAIRIWAEALSDSPVDEHPSFDSWLTVAINNPGGRLAEYWLQRVSAARRLLSDSWDGIPEQIVLSLKTMLSSTSGSAAHVRIVLASQVHYFFSLDTRFTCQALLPLFDWKQDPLRAEQSWHGFLIWGRVAPGLLEALLPHFTEALRHIGSFPKEMRNRLSQAAAGVVFYEIKSPIESEFLKTTFQHFEENDLIQFAWGIGDLLEKADMGVIDRVWNGWLKEYWYRRSLGLPRQVSSKEANVMASWTIDLRDFFPEGVAILMLLKERLSFEHSRLLIDIEKKHIIKKYPEASANLILLYLASPKSLFYNPPAKDIWLEFKSSGVSDEKLKQVREAMYRKLGIDPDL
jgi:Domain of unknown function (DUF4020)/SIR2-like domain